MAFRVGNVSLPHSYDRGPVLDIFRLNYKAQRPASTRAEDIGYDRHVHDHPQESEIRLIHKLLNHGSNVLGSDYAQNISYRYTEGLSS